MFAKAANMLNNGQPYNDGDEIDYSEATVVGLRGLCSVGTEEYQPTGGGEKRKKNKIIAWLTENPKQARNMAMVKAAEPSSETPAPDDDDLPF